jgi:hypothetical protein
MLDSALKATYDKLDPIAEKHDKYLRYSNWIAGSYPWVFLITILSFFIIVLLHVPNFLFYWLPVFLSYYVAALALIPFFNRKAHVYHLSPDELVTYEACKIMLNIENLTNPVTDKRPELKKQYQKSIERQANLLLSVLERDWTVGEFKLASDLGESLSKLKQGFREKVIPNIENGDPKDLALINSIMLGLVYARYLHDLEILNAQISGLESRAPSKKEPPALKRFMNSRAVKYLREQQGLQYLLLGVAMLFGTVAVYFIGIDLVHISRETSFGASVGFFGVLIVAYATYAGGRARGKEKIQTP